eukprot:scaffold268383_cov37-Prasinocladus_malaysianus.AAC.2
MCRTLPSLIWESTALVTLVATRTGTYGTSDIHAGRFTYSYSWLWQEYEYEYNMRECTTGNRRAYLRARTNSGVRTCTRSPYEYSFESIVRLIIESTSAIIIEKKSIIIDDRAREVTMPGI